MLKKLVRTIACITAMFPLVALGTEPPRDEHSIILRLAPLPGKEESPVVTALAVSEDQRWLAAAGDDHVIRILDLVTFEEKARLEGHEDWVQSLAFSPNNNFLASCGNDGQLWSWKVTEEWKGAKLAQADHALMTLRFHPDGDRLFYAGFGSTVDCWSIREGKSVASLVASCNDVRAIDVSPGGEYLAWGGRDGKLHIYDLEERQWIYQNRLHTERIRGVQFTNDGAIVTSVGEDRRVCRYDVLTSTLLLNQRFPTSKWLAVKSIDSVTLGLAGSDNSIHFYSTVENADLGKLIGHRGSIKALCIAGDQLISSGFDTTIRVWDLNTTWQVLETTPSDVAQATSTTRRD